MTRTEMMKLQQEIHEIEQSIDFGEVAMKAYQKDGEQVPEYIYNRLIFLYKEEIRNLKEQLKA